MDNLLKDNWMIFSASIFTIITLIILSEFFFNKKVTTSNFNRKLIHILVGCFASFSPLFFSSNLPSIALALIFIFIDTINVKYQLLRGIESINKLSMGTIFSQFPTLYFHYFFGIIRSFLFSASLFFP